MIWRAMSTGGAVAPPENSTDPDDPTKPGLNNARTYITLKSRRTGRTYKVGCVSTEAAGYGYMLFRVQSGTGYTHEARLVPVFGADMQGIYGLSPPFHGVGDTPSAELEPRNVSTNYPFEDGIGGILLNGEVLTEAEALNTLFTLNWDSCVGTGTNLFDVFLSDVSALIEASPTAVRLNSAVSIYFDVEGASYYYNLEGTINAIDKSDTKYSEYAYNTGIFDYATQAAIQDIGMWRQINFYPSGGASSGTQRVGWGEGSLPTSTYSSGVSGFAKYGKPAAYIMNHNGNVGICTNSVNNYFGTGDVMSNITAWPYWKIAGLAELYGIEFLDNPDYKKPASGAIQYRLPGYATYVMR